MDFLTRFKRQVRTHIFLLIAIEHAVIFFAIYAALTYGDQLPVLYIYVGLAAFTVTLLVFTADSLSQYISRPIGTLWQAVQHVSPSGDRLAAPDLKQHKLGRELVSTLTNHIYQLASVVGDVEKTNTKAAQDLHRNFVANTLPLPLLVIDGDDNIVYVNNATAHYLNKDIADIEGKNVYTTLDMAFTDEDTLYGWLKKTKSQSAIADNKWERVRIGLPGQRDSLLFDLAAYYNKGNTMGYETILVLFDHTEVYKQDDQAMSFVALSVHELRTPLTLLRGYIEVFDEEIGPTLNPELKTFMKKMDASAQQLAAFVDNILNVAKVEDNQLTLQLHEENWANVVDNVVRDLSLRASVRGITLKTDIAAGLPTVGVDRYSIYEVIANLIDNAIKYSQGTSEIYVTTILNKEGLIETSVKDFGLGIDGSILPHVFDKFYRNHRNRAQIGGTGLGLYLSKSIVDAHGGSIWVSSKVDAGSTFSFTVLPFSQLEAANKNGTSTGVTRNAHGWIRNHSLYRD